MTTSDDNYDITFRDVITLALAGFVCLIMLMLPYLNPIAKEEDSKSPGNILIELTWPPQIDGDIDLWVEDPRHVIVGYTNKQSPNFDLLRDDIGRLADPTNINYELMVGKEIVDGEYVINVHRYNSRGYGEGIPCTVSVSLKADLGSKMKYIATARTELRHDGQELTVIRFTLKDGEIDKESISYLQKPLRGRDVKR